MITVYKEVVFNNIYLFYLLISFNFLLFLNL